MMATTNVEQASVNANAVPNHPLDPDPEVIAPASSTVRLYKVMNRAGIGGGSYS